MNITIKDTLDKENSEDYQDIFTLKLKSTMAQKAFSPNSSGEIAFKSTHINEWDNADNKFTPSNLEKSGQRFFIGPKVFGLNQNSSKGIPLIMEMNNTNTKVS